MPLLVTGAVLVGLPTAAAADVPAAPGVVVAASVEVVPAAAPSGEAATPAPMPAPTQDEPRPGDGPSPLVIIAGVFLALVALAGAVARFRSL